MNFPSASPNENMNIDSSIKPMPARRAERSSNPVEILAMRVIRNNNPHPEERTLGRVSKDDVFLLMVRDGARAPPHHEAQLASIRNFAPASSRDGPKDQTRKSRDSGFALRAPRNDGDHGIDCRSNAAAIVLNRHPSGNQP